MSCTNAKESENIEMISSSSDTNTKLSIRWCPIGLKPSTAEDASISCSKCNYSRPNLSILSSAEKEGFDS